MPARELTPEQLAHYHDDGYLFVPGLFDREEVDMLRRIGEQDPRIHRAHIMPDKDGGQSRIWLTMETTEDVYSTFAHCPRIAVPMQQILGGPIYHWHHKMMLKEPLVGGAWEWHQDYGYWYNDGVLAPLMASCMIAVDRAYKGNGCLQVLRGSHHLGRVDHGKAGGQAGADLERVEAALRRCELIYCEMEPGTALFFHCNLLHRSDQNRSPDPRWSLICCYNALRNAPFNGRGHGKPEPLDIWPDTRIKEVARAQLQRLQSGA